MKVLKYFSVFSGIGGFEKGFIDSGIDAVCVGYSEIDRHAVAVYTYHFGDHTNYGNARDIIPDKLPGFNCLCAGFPCQAFSIAGKRRGFEDTRGTLFFEVARILSDRTPELILLENVQGLLSHDEGRTFYILLRVLTEIGYSVEWILLNSKDFGVPQNRDRAFIVGCFGKEPGCKVFPVKESFGISDESGEKQQGFPCATAITANYRKGVHAQGDIYIRTGTLRTHKDGRGFREKSDGLIPTIQARAREREDGSGQPVIVTRTRSDRVYKESDIVPAIRQNQDPQTVRVIQRGHGFFKGSEKENEVPTIRGASVSHNVAIVRPVTTPNMINKGQNGRIFKDNGDPMFTLTGYAQHGVQVDDEIRRLTPLECERLQGFPDNWTKYGIYDGVKKEVSDTQRYKMIGNAVTTKVVKHLIRKIT